jgi:uncharacterized protein YbjT (DUF2867 family)
MAEAPTLLFGVTGLVGGYLLEQLQGSTLHAVARDNPKVRSLRGAQFHLADPQDWPTLPLPSADRAFIALGTTMRKAGSEAAFRAVDYDAVLAAAKAARSAGVTRLGVVSSLGADPASRNFYLRLKSETEQALQRLGLATLVIIRPSLLLGPRQEFRPGEKLGTLLAPLLSGLLMGRWRRYRAVHARDVATTLRIAVDTCPPGVHIIESKAITARGGGG